MEEGPEGGVATAVVVLVKQGGRVQVDRDNVSRLQTWQNTLASEEWPC